MTIWENGKVREATEEELKLIQEPPIGCQIEMLKQNLEDTDHEALKHSEGEISDEEYEPLRLQRRAWREEIKKLRKEVIKDEIH